IMDTTKAQQIALYDALVAPANRLKIEKCNHQLSSDLKSNKPTIQVICPRLSGQKFEDPPFEEEILSFVRDLGHTEEIKEDLVYQVESKNSEKNNDMCYLRFTKVIVDYFMSKDQSMSKRNKMFWHTAIDDPMFNTIRVISRHQDTQIYGAILPYVLTNQEMLDSKAYKEYYDIASVAKPPKAKINKKDFHISHASGSGDGVDTQLNVPDDQEQKTSGTDEGTGTILGVPDVPPYKSEKTLDDEEIIDDEEDDEVIKELYDEF
nr:hypothetical protein [Tanacetum cinerariifolium]